MRTQLLIILLLFSIWPLQVPPEKNYDPVIYGGTAAAITAAIQAAQMGKSVVIVSPDKYPG